MVSDVSLGCHLVRPAQHLDSVAALGRRSVRWLHSATGRSRHRSLPPQVAPAAGRSPRRGSL